MPLTREREAEILKKFKEAFNGGVAGTYNQFEDDPDHRDIEGVRSDTKSMLENLTWEERRYVLTQSMDNQGNTPLHLAAINGDKDLAEILVKNGANLNDTNEKKETPEQAAIANQRGFFGAALGYANTDKVKEYLQSQEAKTDALKAETARKREALPAEVRADIEAKSEASTKSVVAANANSSVANPNVSPSSTLASAQVKPKKATTTPANQEAANEAALKQFRKVFDNPDKTYIEDEVSEVLDHLSPAQQKYVLSQRDEKGNPPLHAAILDKNQGLIDALMFYDADVNATNKDGKTPLHLAALNNDQNLTKTLIDRRANVNAQDSLGNTPLHIAAKKGRVDLSKLLVDHGADPTIKNNPIGEEEGKTPQQVAGITKFQWLNSYNPAAEKTTGQYLEQITEDRKSAQESVNVLVAFRNRDSKLSAQANEREKVNAALANLERVSKTEDFKDNPESYLGKDSARLTQLQTVLDAQLGTGPLSTFGEAASNNIDLNLRTTVTKLANDSNKDPHHAEFSMDIILLNKAIDYDTGTGTSMLGGRTANLLRTKTPEEVKKLLSAPLDSDGNTALHRAAKAGNVSLSSILVNNGADITQQNFLDQKPVDVAGITTMQAANIANPYAERRVGQYLSAIENDRNVSKEAVKTLVKFHDRVKDKTMLSPAESQAESEQVTKALKDLEAIAKKRGKELIIGPFTGDPEATDFYNNPNAYIDPKDIPAVQAVIKGQSTPGPYQPYKLPNVKPSDFTTLGAALDAQSAKASATPIGAVKTASSAAIEDPFKDIDDFIALARVGNIKAMKKALVDNPELLKKKDRNGKIAVDVILDEANKEPKVEYSEAIVFLMEERKKQDEELYHDAQEGPQTAVSKQKVPGVIFKPISDDPYNDLDEIDEQHQPQLHPNHNIKPPMTADHTAVHSSQSVSDGRKKKLMTVRDYKGTKADIEFNKELSAIDGKVKDQKIYQGGPGEGTIIETRTSDGKFTFEPDLTDTSVPDDKIYKIEIPREDGNGNILDGEVDTLIFNKNGDLLEYTKPSPETGIRRLDETWLNGKIEKMNEALAAEQEKGAAKITTSSKAEQNSSARISSPNSVDSNVAEDDHSEKLNEPISSQVSSKTVRKQAISNDGTRAKTDQERSSELSRDPNLDNDSRIQQNSAKGRAISANAGKPQRTLTFEEQKRADIAQYKKDQIMQDKALLKRPTVKGDDEKARLDMTKSIKNRQKADEFAKKQDKKRLKGAFEKFKDKTPIEFSDASTKNIPGPESIISRKKREEIAAKKVIKAD